MWTLKFCVKFLTTGTSDHYVTVCICIWLYGYTTILKVHCVYVSDDWRWKSGVIFWPQGPNACLSMCGWTFKRVLLLKISHHECSNVMKATSIMNSDSVIDQRWLLKNNSLHILVENFSGWRCKFQIENVFLMKCRLFFKKLLVFKLWKGYHLHAIYFSQFISYFYLFIYFFFFF